MFEVSLKGQVCLITGATRGIGKAVALTMAKADLMGLVIRSEVWLVDQGQG